MVERSPRVAQRSGRKKASLRGAVAPKTKRSTELRPRTICSPSLGSPPALVPATAVEGVAWVYAAIGGATGGRGHAFPIAAILAVPGNSGLSALQAVRVLCRRGGGR